MYSQQWIFFLRGGNHSQQWWCLTLIMHGWLKTLQRRGLYGIAAWKHIFLVSTYWATMSYICLVVHTEISFFNVRHVWASGVAHHNGWAYSGAWIIGLALVPAWGIQYLLWASIEFMVYCSSNPIAVVSNNLNNYIYGVVSIMHLNCHKLVWHKHMRLTNFASFSTVWD